MQIKLTALLLCASSALAQNNANFLSSPVFTAFDNNGVIVASGKLCTYYASTTTPAPTYSDAAAMTPNTNPVVMDSAGRARIYSNNNLKLVLQQPGDSSCPGTGAVIWTMDNVFVFGQNPTFATVAATTFNATATGSTAAFQQFNGTFVVTGAGNVAAQTYVATTTFNSLATGSTAAFQTGSGSAVLTGAGNLAVQSVASNYESLVGLASAPTAPGAGFAFVYYDSTLGQIRYNLGGAGWGSLPTVPGATTQLIYNNAGAFAASSHLTFAADTLTLGGSSTTGVVAPLFNAINAGTDHIFQSFTGSYYVTGNGDIFAQSITPNHILTGTSSNTDTAGIVTLSGGTFTLNWPSGHFYSSNPVCVGNDFTANHSVSVAGHATNLVFNGTGSDQIQFVCVAGVY